MHHPSVGLVLGGGGVLGAAHVGALQALQEVHLSPGIVVGTSAGALVGAVYAAGVPHRTIRRMTEELAWTQFGRFTFYPRLGLLDSRAILTTVEAFGGDRDVDALSRTFGVFATSLRSRRGVLITSGPLGSALRGSMAVPGMFTPVVREHDVLVDGGLTANLPIEAAYDLGATHVIAVRLRPERPRFDAQATRARVSALETLPTTLLVRPELAGIGQWATGSVDALITAGYRATRAALATPHGRTFLAAAQPGRSLVSA